MALVSCDTVRWTLNNSAQRGIEADSTAALVLTNLGEKMSDDEVDELLKAVDTSSGEINYMGLLTRNSSNDSRLTTVVDLVKTILAN